MKMHNNYTYVFTSSEYTKPFFAEAFNQPIEKMKVFPLPRIDVLLDEKLREDKKKKIYHYHVILEEDTYEEIAKIYNVNLYNLKTINNMNIQ